jgi:hypothetical protein
MRTKSRITVLALVLLAACGTPVGDSPNDEPTMRPASAPATAESPTGGPVASATAAASMPTPSTEPDPLLDRALTDVRTGETFTLAKLAAADGPVLLEPMAIWCTNCRAQQHEVVAAHEIGTFTSVSLDVDLSEAPADLADYAEREGFDWRFAMADADLYRLLQERFGLAATNPPSTPLIVVERDGSIRPLAFGQGTRSAEVLLAELGAN